MRINLLLRNKHKLRFHLPPAVNFSWAMLNTLGDFCRSIHCKSLWCATHFFFLFFLQWVYKFCLGEVLRVRNNIFHNPNAYFSVQVGTKWDIYGETYCEWRRDQMGEMNFDMTSECVCCWFWRLSFYEKCKDGAFNFLNNYYRYVDFEDVVGGLWLSECDVSSEGISWAGQIVLKW